MLSAYFSFCIYLAELTPKYLTSWIILCLVDRHEIILKFILIIIFYRDKLLESSWNVMAHGDAREGKWRGNWRMEWIASIFTLPRNMVYPAFIPLIRTTRLPAVDWTDASADLNPFRRKTKSGFCACAITFQKQSTWVQIFIYVKFQHSPHDCNR